jgi:hypothetical protein
VGTITCSFQSPEATTVVLPGADGDVLGGTPGVGVTSRTLLLFQNLKKLSIFSVFIFTALLRVGSTIR